VGAQVLGELVDPLGQQRNLDLGRAGVAVGPAEPADQLLLLLLGQRHLGRRISPQGGVKLAQRSRASATSRRICATRSSTLGNRRSPRSRAMNATRSVLAYRSPSQSIRWLSTSTPRPVSNVGRTPTLTAAGCPPAKAAYTP